MTVWIWVARWRKKEDNVAAIKEAAEAVRSHWKEMALDIAFDPDKNVTVAESDVEIRVGISKELSDEYSEGPGEWAHS